MGLGVDAQGGQSGGGSEIAAGATDAFGGSSGATGDAGQAGAENMEPTANIAARWGMVDFEDPVGLQLFQTGGVLSGEACADGTPPLDNDLNRAMWCGPVSGSVVGQHASFGFSFPALGTPSIGYLAETTISADGSRMTGRFHGVSDWISYPMAWLKVADGMVWLPRRFGQYTSQLYDLQLTRADGTEYVPDKTYTMRYSDAAFGGDLGSFAWSETRQDDSPDAPIYVGPVAMTVPELPVSMVIQVQNEQFTQFAIVTGSGHHYVFSAVAGGM